MYRTMTVAVAVALAVAGCSDDTDPGYSSPDSWPSADANLKEAGADGSAKLDMKATDGPVKPGPDGPVTVKPDGTVKPGPDGPVTVKPDGSVKPVPDGPVKPVPDGKPLPDSKAKDAMPPDGPKVYPDFFSGSTCKKHCDCAQGQACITNKCATVTAPIYCCSKTPCPAGKSCVTTSNTWTTCSGGGTTGCKQNCDCKQGEACLGSKCIKTTPATYCCTKTPCPAGTLCSNANGSAGFCPGGGTSCKTHCDCAQGKTCIGGNCISAVTSYCCSKSNCPKGYPCYDTSGSKSYCK